MVESDHRRKLLGQKVGRVVGMEGYGKKARREAYSREDTYMGVEERGRQAWWWWVGEAVGDVIVAVACRLSRSTHGFSHSSLQPARASMHVRETKSEAHSLQKCSAHGMVFMGGSRKGKDTLSKTVWG